MWLPCPPWMKPAPLPDFHGNLRSQSDFDGRFTFTLPAICLSKMKVLLHFYFVASLKQKKRAKLDVSLNETPWGRRKGKRGDRWTKTIQIQLDYMFKNSNIFKFFAKSQKETDKKQHINLKRMIQYNNKYNTVYLLLNLEFWYCFNT